MIVNLMKPSITEAQLEKGTESNVIAGVKPRRWSTKEQLLTVVPVEVVSNDGEVLDACILTVNQRSGKLSLVRVSSTEIACEADTMKKGDKKKGVSL